ncbi:MAG: tetratricopeptide repeat protein [Bacteroidetes bacterium]|nr:tetratricopeptide repeat protein [Bacteroidota bacterium]
MSHNSKHSVLFTSGLIMLFVGTLFLIGCGEMEEIVQEESTSTSAQQQPAVTPSSKAINEDEIILTRFIGPKEEVSDERKEQALLTQMTQYEKQLQDLQAENSTLKQKLMMLEQENRNLTLRLSDTESKLALEAERANRAEAAAKSSVAVGATDVAAAPVTPSVKAKEQDKVLTTYEDALRAFNSRRYNTALKSFQALLDGGVSEDMKDNCIYWIGESQYALKNYSAAIQNFKEVLTIPRSEKKADAQFMIAQCYDRLGQIEKAKEAYELVVKNYPLSRNVKRAKARLAQL